MKPDLLAPTSSNFDLCGCPSFCPAGPQAAPLFISPEPKSWEHLTTEANILRVTLCVWPNGNRAFDHSCQWRTLCKQDITSKFPQTEKNQSTNPKAWMVLLGSKSRCSGAKFGFISGQLYCSSEVVKTPGRGMFLLQSQMLPPWELIEVFQSCRRSTFSALVLVWDPGLIWRTELGPIRLGGYDWGRWKRQDGSSLL